MLGLSLI